MRVIVADKQAKSVASRWREQYYDKDTKSWTHIDSGSSKSIYNRLRAMKRPTAHRVSTIIGNDTWTSGWCRECAEYAEIAIEFCEHGDSPAVVCTKCIAEAHQRLQKAESAQ